MQQNSLHLDYSRGWKYTDNHLLWDKKMIAGVEANASLDLSFFHIDDYTEELDHINIPIWKDYIFRSPFYVKIAGVGNRTGYANTLLTDPLEVLITDTRNKPLDDVWVFFRTEGDVSLNEYAVKTDDNGIAQVHATLGNDPISFVFAEIKDADNNFIPSSAQFTLYTISASKPQVTTSPASGVSINSATVGGSILDDGGATVSEKGVYWGTSHAPELTGTKLPISSGGGSFSSTLSGLQSNQTYYVKAFATNVSGTSYGSEVSFTTSPSISKPSLTTHTVINVGTTSANSGGTITSSGGAPILGKGVCWSTSQYPTTDDPDRLTTNGTGSESFSSYISGLSPNTTYYVRAYAINSAGTGYGNQISFTTNNQSIVTGSFTDSRDGRTYEWVEIGNQTWMAENLAYLPTVSPASMDSEVDPHLYVYDYDGSNVAEAKASSYFNQYGVLYNWPAAIESCPSGWHLPSDSEWKELEIFLGMSPSDADRTGWRGYGPEAEVGRKLKATSGWMNDGNGTNDYGFNAIPGGHFYVNAFSFLRAGFWWTSTAITPTSAMPRKLDYYYDEVYRNGRMKHSGLSVRCVKN